MKSTNSQVPHYVCFTLFSSIFLSFFDIIFSTYYFFVSIIYLLVVSLTVPVAVRSKSWVYGRSHARTAGSNPAGGMHVSVVSVVCCQIEVYATGRSLVQRNPTAYGVSECDREISTMRFRPTRAVELQGKKNGYYFRFYCYTICFFM